MEYASLLRPLFLLVTCFFAAVSQEAFADLTAVTPTSTSVTSCADYFTSEWAEPLDMSNDQDILYALVPRESQQLSTYSYSGGLFSTSATGSDPYFRVLTWTDGDANGQSAISDPTTSRYGLLKPLGSANNSYSVLTFRMYTDVAKDFQVYWDKPGSFAITEPVTTYAGWNTYQIDLSSASISQGSGDYGWSSGKVIGLRIDPTRNSSGAQIKLDWMQLTPSASSCSSMSVGFTAASSDYVSIFVDDNNDPTDGYLKRSNPVAGSVGSTSFSSNLFFPGAHRVYGISTNDYASTYMNPWDMDSNATDVTSTNSITLSGNGFSEGKFCGTVGSDGNFYLNLPDRSTIDASTFTKFKIGLELGAGNPDFVVLNYFDTSGALKGSTSINTNGSGTYQADLSGASGWSGTIGSLRINPAVTNGRTFCVDYVSLGAGSYVTSPTVPTIIQAASTVTLSDRPVVKFVQPDYRGGRDYFATVRGKPSNFSTTADIDYVDGLSSAQIYPGSAYTDSGGNARVGDFFQGTSVTGNDDPQNFSVFLDTTRAIDPTYYKIACFKLDVLASTVDIYHSVARILWQVNGQNVNGDDLVIATTGEKEYCLRMDTLKVEPDVAPGPLHPWRKSDDGTGINFWRIDPHEESVATSYRFGDIRLASDHQADSQFAIVLNGDRSNAVSLYYTQATTATAGTLIQEIASGRNSNVILWNTSALSDGTYRIYATVGSNSFISEPIVISHTDTTARDTTAPILSVDAPLEGHRFSSSLEVGGNAVDDVRIAVLEAFVDGQFLANITPSEFRKSFRDAYPAYPFNSASGFHVSYDLSSYSTGSHTFTLRAYDTAGNITTHSASIVKASDNLTPALDYPTPTETPAAVTIPASPTPTPSAAKLSVKVSGKTMSFTVEGVSSCSTLRLHGNYGKNNTVSKIINNKPVALATVTSGLSSGTVIFNVSKFKKTSQKGNLYFAADCGSVDTGGKAKLSSSKLKKGTAGTASNFTQVLKSIKSKIKKSS